jgi:hypothetical protein
MSQVIGRARGRAGESWLDVVAKLLPAEVMTLFAAAKALSPPKTWEWALIAMGAVLTPLVLWVDGRRAQQAAPGAQYVLRTLAFVSWALAVAPQPGVKSWITAIAVVLIPLIGSFVFPPSGPDA